MEYSQIAKGYLVHEIRAEDSAVARLRNRFPETGNIAERHTQMKCPRVSGQHGILLKYVGGRLDENAAAAVSRHLQTCHACTETVREYSAVFDALSAWHPPCISTNCNRTLPPGTEPANSEPWYKRMSGSLHPDFVRVGLPMAAGVVLIAAGLIFDHWFDSASAPVPRLSVTEAEQAESTLDDIQLLRQFDNAVASSGSSQSM